MAVSIDLPRMNEDTPLSLQTAIDLPVEDLRRARELYRHVEPYHLRKFQEQSESSNNGKVAANALQDALEPYVQLASLRCNAQRAFITLIDRETQYFIAEASRTADRSATETFEKHEKLQWLGCEGVSKSGKLCEITIKLHPSDAPYPIFAVKDLAQDARFSHLPFVQGNPQFRFYAGTPLTTKKGINIGSLCIMDVEPRELLNQEQTRVLGWLAKSVITHLEINREAMEGRRFRLMSNALNVFVDGRRKMVTSSADNLREESTQVDETHRVFPHSKRGSRSFTPKGHLDGEVNGEEVPTILQEEHVAAIDNGAKECQSWTKDMTTTSSDPSSDEEDVERRSQDDTSSESHKSTFARAANILRECFQMEGDDGVAFLAGGTGLTHTTRSSLAPDTNPDGEDEIPTSPTHRVATSTLFDPLISAFTKQVRNPAPILACSTKHEPFLRGQYPAGRAALGDVDQDILRELFKRYPQGKIWVLENGSFASSSEDDDRRTNARGESSQRQKRSQRRRGESSIMTTLFPGAAQILFVPLWDAGASRWASGCFLWSTSETRVFSTATDLGFLSAFGKTIMAECSRLDTLLADQQKADFIGSISHELRSPLHGILAGAEFLTETTTSAFQRSLIETVEACGRTLLDTINHVLDFSKINSLDRDWRNNRQSRKRLVEGQIGRGAQMSAKQLPSGAPPLLRLYAVTDLAAVTEEVVEGLSVGQIYSQSTDLTDVSPGNRGRGVDRGLRTIPRTHGGREDGRETTMDAVEVLLDIAKEDWVFMAQPGVIRRTIMNLLGNSIKYTSSGTIKVQLRLESLSGSDPRHSGKIMVLTISDTGKGIAPKFLSSRLFVPFAQENTLSPGTGLGLSIVRSMVTMMGGNIDIKSRLGEGTTAQVSLPLMRPPGGSDSTQSTPQSTSTGNVRDDSVQTLCEDAVGCIVSINKYFEKNDQVQASSREYAGVLASYVRDWYGLELCGWEHRDKAHVLILEERDLPAILQGDIKAGVEENPALIVLCSNATRRSEAEADRSQSRLHGVFEYISKPCGPYKLARALRVCLERMQMLRSVRQPTLRESFISSEDMSLKELDLPALPGEETPTPVQANGTLSASQITRNAQMAINDQFVGEVHNGEEYPFPSERTCSTVSPLSPEVQDVSKWVESAPEARPVNSRAEGGPRILLVDDNKINLRLLETFLHRRKYKLVDSAEDGSIAVNAVKVAKEPYDIIFMDISMPVLNGFEATRAIRIFEAEHKLKPALVIALTGLANSRDQAEGFSSGCDIYMTKPVSFKELAKLLKNCEGNLNSMHDPHEYSFVTLRGGVSKGGDAI